MLDTLVGFLYKTVIITVAFGILILVHEFGHFLVARLLGVRVLRFSIGFGPRVFGWRRGETEYRVSWLPLGGYVKMAGEQQSDATNAPGEYLSKPVWVRWLIVFAGPVVNYLLAWFLLIIFLMAGYPGLQPVIGEVVEGMPAQAAGFQPGDEIIEVDGKRIFTWDEMTAIIHTSVDKPLTLKVQRDGQEWSANVAPRLETITDRGGQEHSIGLIGIAAGGKRLNVIEAVGQALLVLNYWGMRTFQALGSMFTGQLKFKDSVTGPVGIVYLTSEAVNMGMGPFLLLLSVFSLSLAIFNCFPIPVLDGGHLFFLLIEGLRGKPVSVILQERAALVGLVLLVTLALFVSVNDFNRFLLNR